MSVKIVTDSTADLSPNFTNDFGITMVPIYAFRSKEQAGLKGISTEDNLIDDDVFQRQ
jgi:fatty acid-binding protein DegV